MTLSMVSNDRRSRALSWLAAFAIFGLAWMALPVGTGLFLGALVAFTLQPFYQRLRASGMRATLAAALCAIASAIVVAGAVSVLAALFVSRALSLAQALPGFVAPDGQLQQMTAGWAKTLAPLHIPQEQVTKSLQDEAMSLGSNAAGVAAAALGTTFGALLTTIFMTLATYSVLVYWSAMMRHAESLLPLDPRHTHALLDELRRVGRQVLRGTILTGLIQGIGAAVAYWVTGVPDPAFWGALTAVASLVPAVGTLLIWVPVGFVLVITHHVGAGIAELGLAAVLVGLIPDYVIRPRLVGSDRGIPTVVTFVALFGGIELFGLVGLVLGPVVAAMSIAVLRTYERELAQRPGAQVILGVHDSLAPEGTTPPPPPSFTDPEGREG